MNTRRTWLLLAVALLSGAGAFWATRTINHPETAGHGMACPWCDTATPQPPHPAAGPDPPAEIPWTKAEFGLSEAELRKVEQLHLAYLPRCAENCRRIEQAGAQVTRLVEQATGMNDELATAIRKEEQARADCRLELMAHLYETAAAMPPEAGKKFLRSAIPTVCPTGHPDVHGALAH